MLPRSGRVDGGVDHARAALALGEPRAAPVRSGWAEATQRGRGNGGKVVRKRGRGMKICRVKYYVDFGGFFIEKRAYAPLRWNHLEHEDSDMDSGFLLLQYSSTTVQYSTVSISSVMYYCKICERYFRYL